MKRQLITTFAVAVCCSLFSWAAALPVIPAPALVTEGEGYFEFDGSTKFAVENVEQLDVARLFTSRFGESAGFVPAIEIGGDGDVVFATDATLPAEGYKLDVSTGGISIKAADTAGFFYALQTLRQLLPAAIDGSEYAPGTRWQVPVMQVEDSPRFGYRSLMVDVARYFMPKNELLKLIDIAAMLKINKLHLHLVDDTGWRIEIKRYPKLMQVGAWRMHRDEVFPARPNQRPGEVPNEGGFYTQGDIREIVAYAADRQIEVIPEIEMPGHEVAAIHCYPELTCGAKQVPIRTTCGVSNELLCPGEEFVYTFLGHVFSELADIFPAPYVHLGGDEAGNPALDCWTNCRKCQALKRRLGITTTDRSENWRLQQYLFDRVIDTLRTRHGKTPMFWYETDFKEIQEGCVTFAWRNGLTKTAAEAAIANRARIMMCPGEHCYFDYPMHRGDMPEVNWGMPVTSLRQTYTLDPAWGLGDDFERDNLLGVAGTLWSECINSPERIDYQAYPRALALAEAGWSLQANRSWSSFQMRLRPLLLDMRRRGTAFSTMGLTTPADGADP